MKAGSVGYSIIENDHFDVHNLKKAEVSTKHFWSWSYLIMSYDSYVYISLSL